MQLGCKRYQDMTSGNVQQEVKKQSELAAIHDFAGKLLQPSLLPRLKGYVKWQVETRKRIAAGETLDTIDMEHGAVPISINLDLTTACNFACDHCVDMDILNTGIKYDHDKLKDSIQNLAERGLRSVIVIGGGEPTMYPKFEEMIVFMKNLGLKIGIVTNGAAMDKILTVAEYFDKDDWIRLSLDSGSDEVFQAMHKPRKGIDLDTICKGIAPIRDKNPAVNLGFSFIIVWKDCEANDMEIHENIHEIEMAAERARKYRFNYIAYKPFLTRAKENNAEIVDLAKAEHKERIDPIMAEIRKRINIAKKLNTDDFRVIESTNLRVFENGTYDNYTHQPKNCHMQFFRQVLSPLGVFNCPVYRHVTAAQVGEKHSYADDKVTIDTQRDTLKLIETFNATKECKEVTCLYNHVNWFIEDLIKNPEKAEALTSGSERDDFFF
jgi:wyosine [tRNA(Phe)-imidazoG37] synthetase (radical SAM superfamily)